MAHTARCWRRTARRARRGPRQARGRTRGSAAAAPTRARRRRARSTSAVGAAPTPTPPQTQPARRGGPCSCRTSYAVPPTGRAEATTCARPSSWRRTKPRTRRPAQNRAPLARTMCQGRARKSGRPRPTLPPGRPRATAARPRPLTPCPSRGCPSRCQRCRTRRCVQRSTRLGAWRRFLRLGHPRSRGVRPLSGCVGVRAAHTPVGGWVCRGGFSLSCGWRACPRSALIATAGNAASAALLLAHFQQQLQARLGMLSAARLQLPLQAGLMLQAGMPAPMVQVRTPALGWTVPAGRPCPLRIRLRPRRFGSGLAVGLRVGHLQRWQRGGTGQRLRGDFTVKLESAVCRRFRITNIFLFLFLFSAARGRGTERW